MKYCKICNKALPLKNKSGYCGEHYLEAKRQEKLNQ